MKRHEPDERNRIDARAVRSDPVIHDRRGLRIVRHVLAALLGSYAFTWGFVALGMAGLVALGVDFHEAETAMMLLAFPAFLPLFLCVFAAARPGRAWRIMGGGAVLMTAAAWALQRTVLG